MVFKGRKRVFKGALLPKKSIILSLQSLITSPHPSYHMQWPLPPKQCKSQYTTPEPGSPSVGFVQWCQDESGFFIRAIRPILVKCKNVKCPSTHCTSCVLKCCPTMCQWNLFLNPGVDIEQIGGLLIWQGRA